MDLLRDGVAYADSWLAHQRELREIPGVVAAIQHDDEILLCNGYGFANLERQEPITPHHIFRIASHSKTFTATAIMQLVERGQVRLDNPVAQYIDWVTAPVTVRQVLNHVAGITRDGLQATFWEFERPFPDAAGLRALVSGAETVLDANQQFKYSNVGYSLLGLVVEAASGTPYTTYVREHILEPLGLDDTGPDTDASVAGRLVTGYSARRPPLPRVPIEDIPTAAMAPATGFYSTAENLCRYARAHYLGNVTLLTDASKREMHQPYWAVEQADAHYGLGLSSQMIGDRRMIGHGGGFPGHSTQTLIDPHARLVVVVLNNTMGPRGLAAPLATTVVRILNFALDAATAPDALPHPRERFTGRFLSLWSAVDVVAFGNKLLALNPDDDDPTRTVTELEVVDADALRISKTNGYGSAGEAVRYERDAHGAITHIWYGGARMLPADQFASRMHHLGGRLAAPG